MGHKITEDKSITCVRHCRWWRGLIGKAGFLWLHGKLGGCFPCWFRCCCLLGCRRPPLPWRRPFGTWSGPPRTARCGPGTRRWGSIGRRWARCRPRPPLRWGFGGWRGSLRPRWGSLSSRWGPLGTWRRSLGTWCGPVFSWGRGSLLNENKIKFKLPSKE